MLIGQITLSHTTNRLVCFTCINSRIMSFDIPDQDLANLYRGAKVKFHINEMDDATDISIISL